MKITNINSSAISYLSNKKLKKAGFKNPEVINGKYSKKQTQTMVKLKQAQFDDESAFLGSELSKKQVKQAIELHNSGFGEIFSIDAVNFPKKIQKMLKELKQEGWTLKSYNLESQDTELHATKSVEDFEFNTLVTIDKVFNSNSPIVYTTRSIRQLPPIEVTNSNKIIFNSSKQTNLSADICANEYPTLGVDTDGFWTIDNIPTVYHANSDTIHWRQGLNREVFSGYSNEKDIEQEFELLFENGEVRYIIHSQQSDLLSGAYNIDKYDLKNYPHTLNVAKEIQEGAIKGAEPISRVYEDEEGAIVLEENYTWNNTTTKRFYKQQKDKTEYSYSIFDENNMPLLNLERSWTKNPDNSTTTIVNGKKYICRFDDEGLKINITLPTGKTKTLDFVSKIKKSNQTIPSYKTAFEFFKTLNGDLLADIENYITSITFSLGEDAGVYPSEGALTAGSEIDSLAHELWHCRDFKTKKGKDNLDGNITSNKDLNRIYNEESKIFKLFYPQPAQEVISYFGQRDNGEEISGLSELVAETGVLYHTYGNEENGLHSRLNYLVRFFPKTIAKIIELGQ